MILRLAGLVLAALVAACGAGAPQAEPDPDKVAPVTAQQSTPSPGESEPASPAAPTVACAAGETTIFQCDVSGGKTLAVCSRGGTRARYRYGGARPEIAVDGGRWARVGYSGGGELQIAFDNGAVRYVVFSRTVRTNFTAGEPNDPAMSDGVVILRDGRFAGLRQCSDDSDASYYGEASEAALQTLPQSDELFTEETARADPFTTQ